MWLKSYHGAAFAVKMNTLCPLPFMTRPTEKVSAAGGKRKQRASKKRGSVKNAGSTLLNPAKLKQLYSTMLRCRLIEEKARLLGDQDKLPKWQRVVAQREASEVGAIIDLLPGDFVAPRRRDLASSFILSTPLKKILEQAAAGAAEHTRTQYSPRRDRSNASMIAGPLALAARLNMGTGVALIYKMQEKPNVVVAFSGDDSMALTSWREAVSFAVAHKLPIVLVVQNDLWAESAGPQAPMRSLVSPEQTNGLPTFAVDGADVVAVYRVAQEAIRRARQGHGPTLIECKTHRWTSYSGFAPATHPPTEDPGGNRPDPISTMEEYLKQKGLWSEAWKERLLKSFRKQLDAAAKLA